MTRYRIIESTNTVTGAKRYTVQIKGFLFGWNTCERELGWNCSEPAVFKSLGDAENYALSMEVEDSWEDRKYRGK
jgi:hypothetical protein